MPFSLRSSTASPVSNDQFSSTGSEFPRQAGQTLRVSKRDAGVMSPTSSYSFDPDESGPTTVSFSPDLIEEKQISRTIERGSPGEPALIANRGHEGTNLSRRKSQFYGEVFAYREPNISARNKIHQYSVITAEVKTNVIVRPPNLTPWAPC